jgi:uncharacterized protein (TIGR03437 family)
MRTLASSHFVTLLAIAIPMGAFGHSYGPPPRVTAAPGDNQRACTQCHSSSALNSGTGSVKILLPGGPFYIPGVKQRVMVQVADPVQKRWGFELSARLNSDLVNSQAGDFIPVDNLTQVICEDNTPKPCATAPLFVTHTSAGTRLGTLKGATFQFDWIPPATNAGPVTLYVAGNAANGDANLTGDLIYTSNLVVTPVTPVAPSLAAAGVVSAATGVAGAVSPNSWVTIYGTNMGATTRGWVDGDFVNGQIPFALDGVSVVLNQFGAPRLAYVGYVSPTQVNFLLPSDLFATATTVQVKNPAGTTTAVPLTVQANAAQLFTADGTNVLATHASGALVGKAAPAAPGETIAIYGTGMGATNPALTPGQVPSDANGLAALPQVTIGGATAPVVSASVVPGTAGVYQVNVQVPSDAVNGSLPLVLKVGTGTSASTALAVQK